MERQYIVKIYNLGLPAEIEEKLYDMLDVDYYGSDLQCCVDDLEYAKGKYQVCPGRSVDDYTLDEYMDKGDFNIQELHL